MANWQSYSNHEFNGDVRIKISIPEILADNDVKMVDACVEYAAKAHLHSPNYSLKDMVVSRIRNDTYTRTFLEYTLELYKAKRISAFMSAVEEYVEDGSPIRPTHGDTRLLDGLGLTCDVQVYVPVGYRHTFMVDNKTLTVTTDSEDIPSVTYLGCTEVEL